MIRTIRLLAGLTVACAALPPAASAETRDAIRGNAAFDRPALAGSGVVVAAPGGARSTRLLWVPAAGPVTILASASDRAAVLRHGASAERVALVRELRSGARVTGQELLIGPPQGPLRLAAACDDTDESVPTPAVDGQVAVFARACEPDHIFVSDGAAARTIEAGGRVLRVAAGGRFVAWLARGPGRSVRATVFSLDSGAPVYTADAGSAALPGGLDVQADGTAVVSALREPGDSVAGPSCGSGLVRTIAWHSVADPAPHPIAARGCEAEVRIAAGRIALVDEGASVTELAFANLAGGPLAPLARFERAFGPDERFDWDGSRAAWSETRCLESAVVVRDASDTAFADPVTCPVEVGNVRLARDRTAHVRITCPNGCRAVRPEGLQFLSPRWLHVVRRERRRTVYSPAVPFDLQPGGTTVLRVPMTARQRSLARRKRRVAVRLKIVGQHVREPRVARTLIARRR